jgi:hypothetical protein
MTSVGARHAVPLRKPVAPRTATKPPPIDSRHNAFGGDPRRNQRRLVVRGDHGGSPLRLPRVGRSRVHHRHSPTAATGCARRAGTTTRAARARCANRTRSSGCARRAATPTRASHSRRARASPHAGGSSRACRTRSRVRHRLYDRIGAIHHANRIAHVVGALRHQAHQPRLAVRRAKTAFPWSAGIGRPCTGARDDK